MPVKNITPQAAAGTNWASPTLAIAPGDGPATFPANTTPNSWLRLTNGLNRTFAVDDVILGVQVVIDSAGAGVSATVAGGYDYAGWGKGANFTGATPQNLSAHTLAAPESWDGADATYFGTPYGLTAGVSASVIHDMGAAVTVGYVEYRAGVTASAVTPVVHYSSDGAAWTAVTWTSAPTSITPGAPGAETTQSSAITSATARYWRLSVMNTTGPRIHQFSLWSGGAAPPPGGP